MTRIRRGKTAEPIEMPFGRQTSVGTRNLVLDGLISAVADEIGYF